MVKGGYQQTEVGIIPKDWVVTTVSDVFDFSGGSQPPRNTFIFKEKEGYIRLLQIRDYKTNKYITYIPEALAQKKCSKEDIMIGRYGPPIFQILKGLEGAYNVALIKAMPKGLDKSFAYHFLSQDVLFDFVDKLSQRSSGQTGVDLKQLNLYKFPLPPNLKEQTAIATALSDMDALISKLDALIQKKKAIKKGAMQELLKPPHRGGKRLEGFDGEWEETTIGSEAPLQRGFDLPTSQLRKGKYPVVYSNGISNFHYKPMVKGPGIITGRSGTIGKVFYVDCDYWPHNTSLWVTSFNNNYPLYMYYLYQFIGIDKYKTGSGVPTLNRNDVHDCQISIPSSISEQKAIATILGDMDSEIKSLEAKKAKCIQLKQGMAQELLTGKTRLV